nr:immunoglobulin light chain junction region [Macaca mulatta]
CQHYYSTPCSV